MNFAKKIEWKEGRKLMFDISRLYEYYGHRVKVLHDFIDIIMFGYEKLYRVASIQLCIVEFDQIK